jgi:hypothetical protein
MYQLTKFSSITRLSDGASIPQDPANSDYSEYLSWVKAGGVPLPVPAPTQAELEAQAAAVKDKSDSVAAKADAKLAALATMTPVQVRAWVATNVATLADAKDALATLAVCVSILARKL